MNPIQQPGMPMQQPGSPMDDTELSMMLELAGLAPQQDQINRQRMMAQQLRGMSGTPQGIQGGRTFTAASPLSHLASAMGQGMAGYREGQAMDAATGMGQQRGGILQKYAEMLRNRRMAGAQPGGPEQLAGPGMDLQQLGGPGMG